jgi:hypothetical protein
VRYRSFSLVLIAAAALVIFIGGIIWRTQRVILWRIHHSLVRTGLPSDIQLVRVGHNVVLTGQVKTQGDYILASKKTAEIVGVGKVINALTIATGERVFDPNQRVGIIDIAIDTYYDDSSVSLQQIEAVLELPQFEQFSVATASTISDIIFDRYGFGVSDLPLSYALLERSILKRNALRSPQDLRAGSLKLPILPRRTPSFVHNAPATITHPQSGFTLFGLGGMVGFNAEIGHSLNSIVTEQPKSSSMFILQVPVTRATALETKGIANLPFTISSNKMSITFAAGTQTPHAHTSLEEADRIAVTNGLKLPMHRKPTVFILDSGWPDAATYSSSLEELHRLVDVAKTFYQLPKQSWADPLFVPPALDDGSQHCVQIREALKEFTDLDTGHAVNVVYVPLSQAQNSSFLLGEILKLYYIRKLVGDKRQVDGSILKGADSFATYALNTNTLKQITGITIDTEGAILEAVWSLAELAAQSDPQRPTFLINESWTVDPGMREDAHSGISAGIAIASVGNTPGQVVNADVGRVDFAGQCATTKSVIAVLDVKPNTGLYCGSSRLDENLLDDSLAVGFDGEVLDGGLCGSSFSAPRVAWILALEEATRSETLQRSEWVVFIQHKLAGTRRQSSDVWQHLYLHPADLLKSP